MSFHLGWPLLRRALLIGLFLVGLSALFVVAQGALNLAPLSGTLVATLLLIQLPHVFSFSVGLAAYWTMDQLCRSGQVDLLVSSGVGQARLLGCLYRPVLALTMVAAVYNVTVFRQASTTVSSLRAVTTLGHVSEQVQRHGVFRFAGFRLFADGAEVTRAGATLANPVLSFRDTIMESSSASLRSRGIDMHGARVTHLSPPFTGRATDIALTIGEPRDASFPYFLAKQPALTLRGVAYALNVLLFALLALLCARHGAWRNRRGWLLLWLLLGVAPALLLENALTNALRNAHFPSVVLIPTLPLVAIGLVAGIQHRALGRRVHRRTS